MEASVYSIYNMQLSGMVWWYGCSFLLVKKKKEHRFKEETWILSLLTQQTSNSKCTFLILIVLKTTENK